MKSKLLSIFLVLKILQGGNLSAWAQEELLVLDPPLRTSFPLQANPGGTVGVKFPILLNDHTILPPSAILRFVYLDPNAGERSRSGGGEEGGPGVRAHAGGNRGPAHSGDDDGSSGHAGEASGGWGSNDGDDTSGIFDDSKKEDNKQRKSELQNEVWTQPDLFGDAFDHATDLGTIFVYNLPSQKRPVTATLDLPEGMLLAEVQGHVQVLGLSEKSRAYLGGIRPEDEIRSFNGGAPVSSLQDFQREYATTKREAKLSGNPTYAMEIWRPNEGRLVSIQIAAPPSIPKFF